MLKNISSLFSLIYAGFYYTADESNRFSNPSFTARYLCSFASMFYLVSLLAIGQVHIIHRFFGGPKIPNKALLISVIVIFLVASGLLKGGVWFGITATELTLGEKKCAKTIAHVYLIGGWLVLIGTAYSLYG